MRCMLRPLCALGLTTSVPIESEVATGEGGEGATLLALMAPEGEPGCSPPSFLQGQGEGAARHATFILHSFLSVSLCPPVSHSLVSCFPIPRPSTHINPHQPTV